MEPFIKQAVVYGHPEDPHFETQSREHALAYAAIWPLVPWLRERLHVSKRFTNDSTLEGELRRNIDLLVEYETNRRLEHKPGDYFGMDRAVGATVTPLSVTLGDK